MTLLLCSYYYKNYLITLNTCTIRLVIRSTRVTTHNTRSTGLPTLSTPMPIRSTCLSIRLSIRNICLSTCVVLVFTTCWPFYNWSSFDSLFKYFLRLEFVDYSIDHVLCDSFRFRKASMTLYQMYQQLLYY